MLVRIFSRRIEFVMMVGVLDSAHMVAKRRQLSHQVNDQRGLAAVLSADNVDSFQLKSSRCKGRFD